MTISLVPSASAQEPADTNYDETKVPSYQLPDPLTCFDGQAVTTPAEWHAKRRPEILRAFTEQVYGHVPGNGHTPHVRSDSR